MNAIEKQISETIRKVEDFNHQGITRPFWLEKQLEAIDIMGDDPIKGIDLLVEGMRDELDYLNGL